MSAYFKVFWALAKLLVQFGCLLDLFTCGTDTNRSKPRNTVTLEKRRDIRLYPVIVAILATVFYEARPGVAAL
jgi:hypothetical protein